MSDPKSPYWYELMNELSKNYLSVATTICTPLQNTGYNESSFIWDSFTIIAIFRTPSMTLVKQLSSLFCPTISQVFSSQIPKPQSRPQPSSIQNLNQRSTTIQTQRHRLNSSIYQFQPEPRWSTNRNYPKSLSQLPCFCLFLAWVEGALNCVWQSQIPFFFQYSNRI